MKYVADDGTEFTTEQECLEHEKKVEDISYSFIVYDENLKIITVDDYNATEYIYILSNAEDVVHYLSNVHGWWVRGINGEGIYKYNYVNYNWEAIDGLISDYLSKAQMLTEVKNKIMKI